jgi:DNA-binding protein HU-beta
MAKSNLIGTQLNRIELVEKIATTHTVSKAEAARILETVTSAIVAAVKKGDPVQIVGFGTFKQVARAARSGFNPSAGTKIKIAAQKVPKFVPGAAFKAAVDPKAAKRKAGQGSGRPSLLPSQQPRLPQSPPPSRQQPRRLPHPPPRRPWLQRRSK